MLEAGCLFEESNCKKNKIVYYLNNSGAHIRRGQSQEILKPLVMV